MTEIRPGQRWRRKSDEVEVEVVEVWPRNKPPAISVLTDDGCGRRGMILAVPLGNGYDLIAETPR